MSRLLVLTALAAVTLPVAACRGESTERAAARAAARRDWCIAEELAVQANTQMSTVDTLNAAGNDLVTRTLYPFTRALYDFAKAREREFALLDSAVAAGTPRDSAAFAERAAQARPRAPTSEVEENAARDYQRRFAEALGNPAHPCNVAARTFE